MGTWSVPFETKQAEELQKLMSKKLLAAEASDKLYDLMGDDGLFDDIDVANEKDSRTDVRPLVKKKMTEWVKLYKRDPDSWRGEPTPRAWQIMQMIANRKIGDYRLTKPKKKAVKKK